MNKILSTALFLPLASMAMAQSLGSITTELVEVDNKSVSLKWNNPEAINGLFDDFEDHTDFEINSAGSIGWTYIDADNASTYTWTAADYPNQGKPMAFIVFNPSKTSPSTETWPDIQPYSGKKFLLDMTVDGGNNDYIISPALSFDEDFQFSFRARSYNETYGKERFRVGYSTTGQNPSDFTFIQEGDYEEVPAAWTLCQYTIPKEAKYVCLNCVSQEAFMFMVDDIFIGTNIVRPKAPALTSAVAKLAGFNLKRNGATVNSDLIVGTTYTDSVPDYGTYSYTVEAVMTDGTTNVSSDPLQVEVPDIRLLPFEDDFDGDAIDEDKWSTPVDENGNENKWCRDYYSYGLVDYSACYPYSNIGKNYSQSLVSRELRTPDASNTYLRFQVRLDNNPKYSGSYVSAEVSTDGGDTWTSIIDIANDEGTFGWRTYECSLAEVLGGAEFFQVRFRAHGDDSWYINYWYVDDVKVWCPETRLAKLTVTSTSGAVAGASVSLTASHGAEYTGTTLTDGTLTIPRMELGTYSLTIDATGYNSYVGQWQLTADGDASLSVSMPHPVVAWSESDIDINVAQEATTSRTLTLSNTGDGTVYWNLTPQPEAGSGTTDHQFEPGLDFDGSGDLQSSVAFDGEYFYTASTYTLGRYYKYDKEGRFIEEFEIPGMYYKLYDMAYDGTYFYGSDYTNTIFQLDFRNKRLVRQWEIESNPSLTITHMAYDERSDQFWVGDWTSLGRVDRDGNVTVSFFTIGSSSDDIAVMGSAFDNISAGGPYLWLANLAYAGNNTIDKLQLLQYDLSNRRLTGVEHVATDVPGYKIGTTSVPNNLGGLAMTTQLVPGQLTLVGILIQSPSRIFTYRMADFDSWYDIDKLSGNLAAGKQTEVKIGFDAIDFELGESREATLKFGSLPTLSGVADLNLKLTATEASPYPRPVDLEASVDASESSVALSWNAAQGSSPVAYKVMRDSLTVATVSTNSYVDQNLVRGTYTYTVRALYGTDRTESALSDTAVAIVKQGAPYFAPIELTAAVEKNSQVTLSWQRPDALLRQDATLRWDNATNDESIGLSDGGYFYAGVLFDADDLEPYRGMRLGSVDVFIKERVQALSLRIYKDGNVVKTQRVATANLKYGEFNTVELADTITIERGCDYTVAFMIMHEADLLPLGVNTGTTIDGKSNLMSSDGHDWYPASYAGFSGYNFNIAANLVPMDNYSEAMPAAYSIRRDGKEVAQTSSLTATETLTEPGTYVYTVASIYDGDNTSKESASASVTIEDIGTPVAPQELNATVERNSKVDLRWGLPISGTPSVPVDITAAAGTSPSGRPELVNQFRGAFTGEFGIASDGNYIYTTRYGVAGVINRYKMDGTFDESLSLATSLDEGFRNLTYDGTNFWASANGSEIHQLDLTVPEIVDSKSISEVARHLTYVPTLDSGRGGFEVGDWETSIYVSMQGAKLADGPALNGAAGSAYYDGTLYTFEQGYDTSYELCARDFATGQLLWHNPITDWTGIVPSSTTASAGGMSVLQTKEGLNLLCATLQEPSGARFMMFDLGSVRGLEGYNVYRNGVKINDEPIDCRHFAETITEPGDYEYQIQTVYIDGSMSELSASTTVTISPATPGDAPTDIKAVPTTDGYDVNLSIVDPTSLLASQYESFETEAPQSARGFEVSDLAAFSGSHSLRAPAEKQCQVVIEVADTYESDFSFSFVARNADDNEGAGTIQILTSTSSDAEANFVNLASATTTEAWQQYSFTLPAQTRYVMLKAPSHYADQFVDALAINSTLAGQVYGYDVMRDGEQLNGSEPVAGPTYTDHNLMPGTYTYKVRAYYDNSSVSPWSDEVEATVDYSNGHQTPGQLTVEQSTEGNTLSWSAPALSGVKELRWHNGISASAAGMPSGGSYYAGVQFDPEDLADYASLSISEVSFYVNQIPDVLFVQLYQGQDMIFEKYVPTMKQYSMNTVSLDTPLRLDATKSLRAVIYVEHNSITVPLGYDEGPAKTGRGDLYSSDGSTWSTLTDNDIDGNWNITIGLQAYASVTSASSAKASARGTSIERYARHAAATKALSSAAPASAPYKAARSASSFFSGYNVYCNGVQLNADTLDVSTTTYLDADVHKGRYYEYQVKAIYPEYGEVGSNIVRILATDIDGIEAADESSQKPAYTVSGTRANSHQRGIVIQDGRKRLNR